MAATIYRKEGDGEWAPYAQYADNKHAATNCQRFNNNAKRLSRAIRYRIFKDEDAARRAKKEKENAFELATTAEEIEHVYVNGPESCMGGPDHAADTFETVMHPARIYAGFDLAVAYIRNADGDIVARSVVWPEAKQYARVYAITQVDSSKLTQVLLDAGYRHGNLQGARIQRVPYEKRTATFIMPYLDNDMFAQDYETFLRIDQDGTICGSSDGYGFKGWRCRECGYLNYLDNTDCEDCGWEGGDDE